MIDWNPSTIPGGGDPLGDIRIRSIAGAGDLFVENTYADAWLDALLRGLQGLVGGAESVVIDLIDEPKPLVVELIEGSVVIRYDGGRVVTGRLQQTCRALIDDVRRLVPTLRLQTETPALLDVIEQEAEELSRAVIRSEDHI